ncbi:MAG: hypothetical protein IJF29_05340 [Firmicutes bacterium]|nr:hypothetical protein [Bacillota bacterium]
MKRFVLTVMVLIISVFSSACSKNELSQIKYGTYKLETNEDVVLRSSITIKEDNSFVFFFDPLSSYLNTGEYKIHDNIITAENDKGDIYIFGIEDEGTLYFIEDGSSEIKPTDENFYTAIENGSKFKYVE